MIVSYIIWSQWKSVCGDRLMNYPAYGALFYMVHISLKDERGIYIIYTETEKSSFWWNVHHWLHWKLSKWQLPVQPVMKISSKWRHFCFSIGSAIDCHKMKSNMSFFTSGLRILPKCIIESAYLSFSSPRFMSILKYIFFTQTAYPKFSLD